MFSRTSLKVVLLCTATVVGVSIVCGEDPTPSIVDEDASHSRQLLTELRQLRRAVGGSVLSGTVLDSAPEDAEADFDAGLRKALGIAPSASSNAVRTLEAATADPRLPNEQVVSMLRKHSSQLDRISNDLECLRRYDNADQLRETATELRQLARQFDTDPTRSSSSAEK